jgi:hypothetical protein
MTGEITDPITGIIPACAATNHYSTSFECSIFWFILILPLQIDPVIIGIPDPVPVLPFELRGLWIIFRLTIPAHLLIPGDIVDRYRGIQPVLFHA